MTQHINAWPSLRVDDWTPTSETLPCATSGIDTVIFWPDETNEIQLRRFTDEVVPGVRATLGIENN